MVVKKIMSTTTETLPANSAILERTRELCSTILDWPGYKEEVTHIEAFLADEEAKTEYRDFAQLGEEMHKKQHAGDLTDTDIENYEAKKAALEEKPLIGKFLAAQDSLNEIHRTVSQHVAKTLELGRMPVAEDFESSGGCCGGGSCDSEGEGADPDHDHSDGSGCCSK
jgi:cell fate (sporulation/competence/biofilm development) regulator YlbF (YheA/YmcA/DUF963 family)